MAELQPNVRLNLASTPENVVLVREMLSGVAEAIDLGGSDLNDVRTAVTEACNNVVLHAYQGDLGQLNLEVCISSQALFVMVCDEGNGIQARPDVDEVTGIGLHVIRTLTHRVEFIDRPNGGTEVRMEFAPSIGALKSFPEHQLPLPTLALDDSPTTTTISIAPIWLARTVLPRIVSALAARAHFSTDRISDVQLLADSLVAHAHTAMSGNHLSVDVSVQPRNLELRITPLEAGRARQLIGDSELDGLGRVIEKLTDRRDIANAGRYETLTLGLVDRR